jgi:DNA-binding NarL/FixJ family response regulator
MSSEQLRTGVLVCLTQQSGREYVQAIFRLGGSAYVLKNEAASELIAALHESLKGRYYLSSELRKTLRDVSFDPRENPADLFGGRLTPRQREVLQLLAEGKSAKEIAHLLGISIKTVEFHKASISDELGIRTTAELTRYAVEQKIVTSSMQ